MLQGISGVFENANAFLQSTVTFSDQDEWLWRDRIFVEILADEKFTFKAAVKRANQLQARQQRLARDRELLLQQA